jgi:hypothetical protein
MLPDERVMLPARVLSLCITGQYLRAWNTQLCRHIVPDASGDLHGVIDECSQKPGCRELKGNSKPVMSAPAMINKIQITFIKMEISRQLDFIWLGGITSIILNLAVGEKISAHRYIPSRFIVP